MKTLVIDANRLGLGPYTPEVSQTAFVACPKWRAVRLLADTLEADVAWRSPKVDPDVRGGYDVLVFNRALPDANDNGAWLEANPHAKVFHVTNDYSVTGAGLYVAARSLGRDVHVIANYNRAVSKVSGRLGKGWLTTNLNSLVYEAYRQALPVSGHGCVYYGACRYGRRLLYQKYLRAEAVTLMVARVVMEQFAELGVTGPFILSKIRWATDGLRPWATSLYLEDSVTPMYSPYLSNRFYEAIAYGVYPVFVEECRRTLAACGYEIPEALVVPDPRDIPGCAAFQDTRVMAAWQRQAADEQASVLRGIRAFVKGTA